MSAGLAVGAVLGVAAASGCLLVVAALDGRRRASLALRLEPYLTTSVPVARAPRAPLFAGRLARFMRGERELAALLAAAGRPESVIEFRSRQAIAWAATSGAMLVCLIALEVVGAPINLGGGSCRPCCSVRPDRSWLSCASGRRPSAASWPSSWSCPGWRAS